MLDIPQHIASKRSAYSKLPKLVRGVIIAAAFAIGAVGAVLSLTPPPLFDIGIILLLLSLSVLSLQFQWAHSALTYITRRLADKSFRKRFLFATVAVFAVIAGVTLLYWL